MKSRDVAYTAIYIAIFAILGFVPYTGQIRILAINITTIPVFVALATYHLGFKGAMTSAISFGLFSYLGSISVNPSILADPVILFVPRIILGFVVYFVYKLLGELKLWKFILLSAITVISNTFLVSAFVFLVSSYNDVYGGSLKAWIVLIYINFIVEICVGIALPIMLYPLAKYLRKKEENSSKHVW